MGFVPHGYPGPRSPQEPAGYQTPRQVCIQTHTALGKQMPNLPVTYLGEQKVDSTRHTVLGAQTHRRPAHVPTHTHTVAHE